MSRAVQRVSYDVERYIKVNVKVVGFGYVEELVPIFDRELATDNPRWGVFIINKSLRRQFQYHLARNPLMVTCVIQKVKKGKRKGEA